MMAGEGPRHCLCTQRPRPYKSSLCPKPGVVPDNMTQGDDVAKSPGPIDPRWAGRPHSLADRPGFGNNEIILSTRVMLSR
jgi:hypothetical protein